MKLRGRPGAAPRGSAGQRGDRTYLADPIETTTTAWSLELLSPSLLAERRPLGAHCSDGRPTALH